MNSIETLLSILLTVFGSSLGVVTASGRRKPAANLVDLVFPATLWFGLRFVSIWLDLEWGLWQYLGASFLVAIFYGLLRKPSMEAQAEAPETGADQGGLWETFKSRWGGFAKKLGDYQSRIVLGIFYFVFVTPFGLIARLFSNPLRRKKGSDESYWTLKP